MEEKKKDLFRRIGMFPNEVQNRLLLVERYFQKMEIPNNAEFNFAEIVIDESQFDRIKNTVWQDEENVFVFGRVLDVLCIPEDDLFVIYNTISDVLREAKELIETRCETPDLQLKEEVTT